MNTVTRADAVIRILSPEMAADKLGWTIASVLKRREELGLAPFITRSVRLKAIAAKRKAAKRLAVTGA